MLHQVLNPRQTEWLSGVRRTLESLHANLARFHAARDQQETTRDLLSQLDELFLLVVVGEFNSGKSAFINALAGQAVLEEGVVPTTSRIQILKHGDPGGLSSGDVTAFITAPLPFLEQINIVDTPGTNAIERHHEAITTQFIPKADLVLFVTSADRPFTESERAFLAQIRDWGKKIVLVINKIDILENPGELERVEAFVRENGRALLGFTPETFSVSARTALRAKTNVAGASLEASRFEPLERYVLETLDEEERIRLKLLNPIGVASRLTREHLEAIEEQDQVLEQDSKAIEELEAHLSLHREDLSRDFKLRLADVDNILHELEARGHDFIEDVVRLPRVFDLVNKEKIKADFEAKVVADAPAQIERRVNDLIDWLVSRDLEQWEFLRDFLSRRRSARSQDAVGDFVSRFDYDRNRLMDSLGRAAQRTLESYDRAGEAKRMADSVQGAVAGAAVLGVSAVGLGTIVTLLATSTAADVTGIFAAGVLAAVGFLIIPQKRRSARKELRAKISSLREQLISSLTSQFDREVARSIDRLNESISPYTRFVRSEKSTLDEKRQAFEEGRSELDRLRTEIQASHSSPPA